MNYVIQLIIVCRRHFIPEAPQGPKKEVKEFEMAFKIFFRRSVALLLCCVLVGSSFARLAYASDPVTAASLAITGGQLAGAGLSGEAALSLAGPVGAVVGVTLGALGVNAYVSQAAQAAGKTRTRFVLDKLVIWGAQAGYTQEQLYSKIAQGISVAADGTIMLANDAAQTIQQFGNWLFTQASTVVPSVSTESESIEISDYTFAYTTGFKYKNIGNNLLWTVSFNTAVAAFLYPNGSYYQICVFAPLSAGAICTQEMENGSGPHQYSLSAHHGRAQYGSIFPLSGNVQLDSLSISLPIINTNPGNLILSLDGSFSATPGEAYDEVFTGTENDWNANRDVLNPALDDTPITLNPDLLNPIIDSLADGQQATMSIIDYLQALQDAWDHALDDVQTAIGTITDTLTGIQEQIAVPDEAVKNPTVTNPSVTPETTPVLDPSAVDPGTVVTGLSFDLTHIFPFCIPFDIYDMLATLSATPEAPVYHVHYEGPYNIVIDFTVDLSPWNSVAAVLRTVELLAFCIGLAYVTRSMFIRS